MIRTARQARNLNGKLSYESPTAVVGTLLYSAENYVHSTSKIDSDCEG